MVYGTLISIAFIAINFAFASPGSSISSGKLKVDVLKIDKGIYPHGNYLSSSQNFQWIGSYKISSDPVYLKVDCTTALFTNTVTGAVKSVTILNGTQDNCRKGYRPRPMAISNSGWVYLKRAAPDSDNPSTPPRKTNFFNRINLNTGEQIAFELPADRCEVVYEEGTAYCVKDDLSGGYPMTDKSLGLIVDGGKILHQGRSREAFAPSESKYAAVAEGATHRELEVVNKDGTVRTIHLPTPDTGAATFLRYADRGTRSWIALGLSRGKSEIFGNSFYGVQIAIVSDKGSEQSMEIFRFVDLATGKVSDYRLPKTSMNTWTQWSDDGKYFVDARYVTTGGEAITANVYKFPFDFTKPGRSYAFQFVESKYVGCCWFTDKGLSAQYTWWKGGTLLELDFQTGQSSTHLPKDPTLKASLENGGRRARLVNETGSDFEIPLPETGNSIREIDKATVLINSTGLADSLFTVETQNAFYHLVATHL